MYGSMTSVSPAQCSIAVAGAFYLNDYLNVFINIKNMFCDMLITAYSCENVNTVYIYIQERFNYNLMYKIRP